MLAVVQVLMSGSLAEDIADANETFATVTALRRI